jgi:hypothetical protein
MHRNFDCPGRSARLPSRVDVLDALGSSASLLDLDLKVSDFPDEQGQIDGTLAHAIERLFFNVCEVPGFRWGPRWRCARYSTPRMADQDSPTQ